MLADTVAGKFRDPRGTTLLPDGKLFIRRTAKAMHTVSWGSKVMIQSFAYDPDPMVCSDWHNGIGFVRVSGVPQNLPVQVADIDIDESSPTRSVILLAVMHGEDIRADITVESHANGKMRISERLTALRDVTTEEIATLYVGILNHPQWIHENGYRTIRSGGVNTVFRSLSGDTVSLSGRRIGLDGRMTVKADNEIDGTYTGATRWYSSKVIDRMILNHIRGVHHWKEGELISVQALEVTY